MCFCTKIDLLIEVDGNKHIIKVEKKGPSSEKTPLQDNYSVIDYDGIFYGNPTIRRIFQF